MNDRIPSGRSLREEAALGGSEEVERMLERLLQEGREAWPALSLAASSFVQHIARHVPERSAPENYLLALHGADLYLACACKDGVPGAVDAFQACYGATVEAAVRGRNVPPAEREELCQAFSEKLFVGRPGAPGKIGDYAGRGPLGGWVRVAAVRMALNFLDRRRSDPLLMGVEVDEAREHSAPDPELDFLKSHYRDKVHQALKDALAGLDADERNVLRLYFLDGLSIDRIAAVYGVHRATVARWVTRGREALLKDTRQLLTERLCVDQGEVESIIGIVRSQIGLTLSSLFLRPEGDAGEAPGVARPPR